MSKKDYTITSLECSGYQSRPLPNRYFRQEAGEDTLAIVYPGLRYTCDMPLLYYTTRAFLARRIDVLQSWAEYTLNAYQSLPAAERAAWLLADGESLLQAGQSQYRNSILIGKSIGTLTMALMINRGQVKPPAPTLWLTPLLHLPTVVQSTSQLPGQALFIGGSQDSTYDQNALATIRAKPAVEAMVMEGADHSLEIPNDPLRSLVILEQVVQAVLSFLDRLDNPGT